jgi:tRNA(Ile)-lysidine synthase
MCYNCLALWMSGRFMEHVTHRSESTGRAAKPARAPTRPAIRDPLGANLDAIFAEIAVAEFVLLAVSGGPDSMALMLAVAEWAKGRDAPKLFVATVDHALRAQSRQEAEQVGVWAQALGLPHQILTWDGNKPKTRLQELAREARYGLLAAYAAEIGADYLLTAHHADDQAETILFRLLRGSGIFGLSGMPSRAERGALTHLRPLLDWPKAALIAFCEARGQNYFRDPSNDDPVFARTRLRRLLPLLAKEGFDRDGLLRLGRRAERIDDALAHAVERLRASLPAQRGQARFAASLGGVAYEPAEIFARLIQAEIQALGAAQRLRLQRLESLAAALQSALQSGVAWRGSLAGLALNLDTTGSLTIAAEKPRRRGQMRAQATENSPSTQLAPGSGHDPVTSG